jgi:hypothetical protein
MYTYICICEISGWGSAWARGHLSRLLESEYVWIVSHYLKWCKSMKTWTWTPKSRDLCLCPRFRPRLISFHSGTSCTNHWLLITKTALSRVNFSNFSHCKRECGKMPKEGCWLLGQIAADVRAADEVRVGLRYLGVWVSGVWGLVFAGDIEWLLSEWRDAA